MKESMCMPKYILTRLQKLTEEKEKNGRKLYLQMMLKDCMGSLSYNT